MKKIIAVVFTISSLFISFAQAKQITVVCNSDTTALSHEFAANWKNTGAGFYSSGVLHQREGDVFMYGGMTDVHFKNTLPKDPNPYLSFNGVGYAAADEGAETALECRYVIHNSEICDRDCSASGEKSDQSLLYMVYYLPIPSSQAKCHFFEGSKSTMVCNAN